MPTGTESYAGGSLTPLSVSKCTPTGGVARVEEFTVAERAQRGPCLADASPAPAGSVAATPSAAMQTVEAAAAPPPALVQLPLILALPALSTLVGQQEQEIHDAVLGALPAGSSVRLSASGSTSTPNGGVLLELTAQVPELEVAAAMAALQHRVPQQLHSAGFQAAVLETVDAQSDAVPTAAAAAAVCTAAADQAAAGGRAAAAFTVAAPACVDEQQLAAVLEEALQGGCRARPWCLIMKLQQRPTPLPPFGCGRGAGITVHVSNVSSAPHGTVLVTLAAHLAPTQDAADAAQRAGHALVVQAEAGPLRLLATELRGAQFETQSVVVALPRLAVADMHSEQQAALAAAVESVLPLGSSVASLGAVGTLPNGGALVEVSARVPAVEVAGGGDSVQQELVAALGAAGFAGCAVLGDAAAACEAAVKEQAAAHAKDAVRDAAQGGAAAVALVLAVPANADVEAVTQALRMALLGAHTIRACRARRGARCALAAGACLALPRAPFAAECASTSVRRCDVLEGGVLLLTACATLPPTREAAAGAARLLDALRRDAQSVLGGAVPGPLGLLAAQQQDAELAALEVELPVAVKSELTAASFVGSERARELLEEAQQALPGDRCCCACGLDTLPRKGLR